MEMVEVNTGTTPKYIQEPTKSLEKDILNGLYHLGGPTGLSAKEIYKCYTAQNENNTKPKTVSVTKALNNLVSRGQVQRKPTTGKWVINQACIWWGEDADPKVAAIKKKAEAKQKKCKAKEQRLKKAKEERKKRRAAEEKRKACIRKARQGYKTCAPPQGRKKHGKKKHGKGKHGRGKKMKGKKVTKCKAGLIKLHSKVKAVSIFRALNAPRRPTPKEETPETSEVTGDKACFIFGDDDAPGKKCTKGNLKQKIARQKAKKKQEELRMKKRKEARLKRKALADKKKACARKARMAIRSCGSPYKRGKAKKKPKKKGQCKRKR